MRRRDNIQAEFEAKSEALASRKADQDAVSAILHPHTLTGNQTDTHHPPSPHLSEPTDMFVCPPVIFPGISFNKVKHREGPFQQGHPQLILVGKRNFWEDYLDIQACRLEASPLLSGSKSCQYYFTL